MCVVPTLTLELFLRSCLWITAGGNCCGSRWHGIRRPSGWRGRSLRRSRGRWRQPTWLAIMTALMDMSSLLGWGRWVSGTGLVSAASPWRNDCAERLSARCAGSVWVECSSSERRILGECFPPTRRTTIKRALTWHEGKTRRCIERSSVLARHCHRSGAGRNAHHYVRI